MSTSVILSNPLSASIAARIGLSSRSYAVGETISVSDATAKSLVGSGYAHYTDGDPDPDPGPPGGTTFVISGTPTDGSFIGYAGSGWAVRSPAQVKTTLAIGAGDVSGLTTALGLLAPLASPALTGTPTAPTAGTGTNTDQLATTAFVQGEVAAAAAATPIDTVAGTTYTLAVGDAGRLKEFSSSADVTVTLPSNATAAIPIGATIPLRPVGTGQVITAAGSGATVVSPHGLKSNGQYATIVAEKRGTNAWLISGDATT